MEVCVIRYIRCFFIYGKEYVLQIHQISLHVIVIHIRFLNFITESFGILTNSIIKCLVKNWLVIINMGKQDNEKTCITHSLRYERQI